MPNSKQIVYLSQAQYQELITNQSITVNGVTVTYDENDIYVTPQAEPITDVKVAGTSVAVNGVANVPVAIAGDASGSPGVLRVLDTNALGITTRSWSGKPGFLTTVAPLDSQIKSGVMVGPVISPSNQEKATFYGLAKAAGHDEKDSTEPLGTYTPEAKGAIQKMLGVSDLIATEENNLIASKAYAVGDIFTANGKLYKATAAIAVDGAIIVDGANANCEETSVGEGFVKFTNYATNGHTGVVKTNPAYGTQMYGDVIASSPCNDNYIKKGTHGYNPLVSAKQHMSVFYGLSKVAGVDLADEEVTLGTYPEASKTAIRSLIGAAAASDMATKMSAAFDGDGLVITSSMSFAEGGTF